MTLNMWQKKQVVALGESLWRLWKGLKILRVGFSTREGFIWQSACSWEGRLLARSSKHSREEVLQRLIRHYVGVAIASSRRQIKRLFRGMAAPPVIDAAIDQLLLVSRLDVDPTLILQGKKTILSVESRLERFAPRTAVKFLSRGSPQEWKS